MLRIDIEKQESLSGEELKELEAMWKRCAARIIMSTTLAGSGHPGGSLSSIHALLLLYAIMDHRPDDPDWPDRDKLLVSIGHISPAVYSALTEYGYCREEDFLTEFRRTGSAFGGHIEQSVPGVEWNTGNLGQGLSAAAGLALAQRLHGRDAKTFCLMGDGEQQKGQIAEARRFAFKYGLSNLVALVDRNHLQICGETEEVMPVRVRQEYEAAGWNVVYVADGNDFNELYSALRRVLLGEDLTPDVPTVLVMRTVMGKGISFMENKEKYHGSPLPYDQAKDALKEIGLEPGLIDEWRSKREKRKIEFKVHGFRKLRIPEIDQGEPIVYGTDQKTDCRSAYGNALKDLAERNNKGQVPKIVGFSCDLEGSVKMGGFHQVSPKAFIETGIQEHHAAVCAAIMSKDGLVPFFSTFGVFAVCETYNQHRLSDQNHTNLKIVSTHNGVDVGEDGPTHQCIDYIGLISNLFGFSIFMPADPNQTDRIVRYVAANPGNVFVGMGRSKMDVLTDEDGQPFFGPDYRFEPAKADLIRSGEELTIMGHGSVMPEALRAVEILKKEGRSVALLNMASIKPVDEEAIVDAARRGPIVTVEDHIPHTGLGGIVARTLVKHGISQRLITLGVTCYGSSGSPKDLFNAFGIDAASIADTVMKEF